MMIIIIIRIRIRKKKNNNNVRFRYQQQAWPGNEEKNSLQTVENWDSPCIVLACLSLVFVVAARFFPRWTEDYRGHDAFF